VSPCDHIILDGKCYHIEWVGPTYFLSEGPDTMVVEPEDPTGGDPTCEMWHEIYPNYCTPWHVDDWTDDGDGELSECDYVLIDGRLWHIDRIGLDIEVTRCGNKHLDRDTDSQEIPEDCTNWHELYPVYCSILHQDGYKDNGDDVISACDYIKLDGRWYHIEWVGPTYFLSEGPDTLIVEPDEPTTGGNPTCEIWHEIYPIFCQLWHVDDWVDNGDGVISVCDYVIIDGRTWHIDRIGLDIEVAPCKNKHLDLDTESQAIPGYCTDWHELYPLYSNILHQEGYKDNGDRVVSACDYIRLDGTWYHIEWVGPTYFLSEGADELIVEPLQDPDEPGQDPTCEIWHEIYPIFSQLWHVDGWVDNGDGELSVCDYVIIDGRTWHIDRIGLDIEVIEEGVVPTFDRSGTAILVVVLLLIAGVLLLRTRRTRMEAAG